VFRREIPGVLKRRLWCTPPLGRRHRSQTRPGRESASLILFSGCGTKATAPPCGPETFGRSAGSYFFFLPPFLPFFFFFFFPPAVPCGDMNPESLSTVCLQRDSGRDVASANSRKHILGMLYRCVLRGCQAVAGTGTPGSHPVCRSTLAWNAFLISWPILARDVIQAGISPSGGAGLC